MATTPNSAFPGAKKSFFSWDNPLIRIPAYIIGAVIGIFLLVKLVSGGLLGGLFSGKNAAAKTIRAKGAASRAKSKALKREDKQDRKDMRALVKTARIERRACRKAAKGVRRRGGARRRAKAECNKRFADALAAIRASMTQAELAEASALDPEAEDGED